MVGLSNFKRDFLLNRIWFEWSDTNGANIQILYCDIWWLVALDARYSGSVSCDRLLVKLQKKIRDKRRRSRVANPRSHKSEEHWKEDCRATYGRRGMFGKRFATNGGSGGLSFDQSKVFKKLYPYVIAYIRLKVRYSVSIGMRSVRKGS